MDIGWTELILIGVVALIVIGPRDLPEMFRTLGRFTAKLRSMSREFSRAMESAAKESGVGDVAKDIRNVTSPSSLGLNAVKDSVAKFEKWDPLKSSKPVTTPAKPAMAVTLPAGNQAVATPVAAAPVVAEAVVADVPKAP
ncbi:MAG: Sec-independent protein translocase protein TatB, partial [Paracoccaceae bacterium]